MEKYDMYDAVPRSYWDEIVYELMNEFNQHSYVLSTKQRIRQLAQYLMKHFKIRYTVNQNIHHEVKSSEVLMILNTESFIWVPFGMVADKFISVLEIHMNVLPLIEALANEIVDELGVPLPNNTMPPIYSGTRYQLFLNGILDIETFQFTHYKSISADTKLENMGAPMYIESVGFINKHVHNTFFKDNFENIKVNVQIEKWLDDISNHNDDLKKWLLYIIGLAILPNANIGANIVFKNNNSFYMKDIIESLYIGVNGQINHLYEYTMNYNSMMADMSEFNDLPNIVKDINYRMNLLYLKGRLQEKVNTASAKTFKAIANNEVNINQVNRLRRLIKPTPTLIIESDDWPKMKVNQHPIKNVILPFEVTNTDIKIDINDSYFIQYLTKRVLKALHEIKDARFDYLSVRFKPTEELKEIKKWKSQIQS
ncbi:hypothetical protein [Staphylococcus aureus]|uniref:hypothetical protein n=1 Tax=Staphylococcus aureus TaxID=1280 RepID=UPI001BFE7B49|nr:hypothetical protein [Staphylococcus aureus]